MVTLQSTTHYATDTSPVAAIITTRYARQAACALSDAASADMKRGYEHETGKLKDSAVARRRGIGRRREQHRVAAAYYANAVERYAMARDLYGAGGERDMAALTASMIGVATSAAERCRAAAGGAP